MEKALETRRGMLLADRPELYLELVADTPWPGCVARHARLRRAPSSATCPPRTCGLLPRASREACGPGSRRRAGSPPRRLGAGARRCRSTRSHGGRVRMLNLHTPASGYSGYIQRLASAAGPEEVYSAREGLDPHPSARGLGADPAHRYRGTVGAGAPGRRSPIGPGAARDAARGDGRGHRDGVRLRPRRAGARPGRGTITTPTCSLVLEGALSLLAFEGASLLAPQARSPSCLRSSPMGLHVLGTKELQPSACSTSTFAGGSATMGVGATPEKSSSHRRTAAATSPRPWS